MKSGDTPGIIQLTRAPFLTAIAMPALYGISEAYRDTGSVDAPRAIITLLGLMCAHCGANLLNDYYDFKLGADTDNPFRSPFSGGSPYLPEGRVSPRRVLTLGLVSFALAIMALIYLSWVVDRGVGPVVYFALAGGALGIFYTAPPLSLAYRGLGELTIFLAFGVLPVPATYYVLTGHIVWRLFLASLPLAFMVTAIIWLNEIPDIRADRNAGKMTLVARMGSAGAGRAYTAILAAAAMSVPILTHEGILAPYSDAVALVPLLAMLFISPMVHRNHDRPRYLVEAQELTVMAHTATGLLMCIFPLASKLV